MCTLLEMPLTGNYPVQVSSPKTLWIACKIAPASSVHIIEGLNLLILITNMFCKCLIEQPKEY